MIQQKRPQAIIIAGPTGSGKTSLAVTLASLLNGEVVNADSMQVYRFMDIGTAKPTPEERQGIPHHMLDIVSPDEDFNAAAFCSMALPLVEEIFAKGKTCFVVGGTGLYIKTLLGGLLDCPPPRIGLRDFLKRTFDDQEPSKLHEALAALDPAAAEKIHPNDRIRLMRALEIRHTTGRSVSELSRRHGFRENRIKALKFCLEIERKELYARIDDRAVRMIQGGLIQETENLLKKGYSADLKPMMAIGYRHVVAYLKGDWTLDEAIEKMQQDTRRYAKRQMTWFRADKEFIRVGPGDFDRIVGEIKSFLGRVS